jgi:type II secretory pathway pseudopilin PulG
MKKLKSFTLIEILIASYIFVMVIIMAVASFAMIKRSNDTSDDIRLTSQCARDLEDFVSSRVRSSVDDPRIMAVKLSADGSIFNLITPGAGSKYSGVAVFKKTSSPDKITVRAIYKKGDGYFYQEQEVASSSLSTTTFSTVNEAKLNSDDCSAAVSNPAGATPETPFAIASSSSYKKGPASGVSSPPIFTITLDDLFYRRLGGTSQENPDNKALSRVYINVVNDLRAI